jgi:hypothetical protein
MKGRLSLAALAVAILATACASTGHGTATAPAPTTGPAATMVAFGGSATEGDGIRDRLRDAWPYVVFHEAMPQSTVLVNAALDGATVANANTLQLPVAHDAHPQIAVAWLGADDLDAQTPIPQFRNDLTAFVAGVKAAGAQRVLLANLPSTFGPGARPYNTAIAQVAAANAVELVDLAGLSVPLEPASGLSPQPTATGQRVVANAFEQELRAQP